MDDHELRTIVENMYRCRVENDIEGCLSYFSNEATLRLAGIQNNPDSSCRDVLTELVSQWRFDSIKNFEIFGEGKKVATRYLLEATFISKQEKVVVEVADWITFDEENRVIELVQHLDTALLLKISGQLG